MSAPLQALLDRGVQTGVFPSAQAVVLKDGEPLFSGAAGDATSATLYDLASLTKVVSTTAAFVALWAEGKLGPDAQLTRFLPDSPAAKAGITLADLLYHRSGLPAFVPFFAPVMKSVPELLSPGCPPQTRLEVRAEVVAAAEKMPLARPVGEKAVYSDVGFILLGEALGRAAAGQLDSVYEEKVARRLGLNAHFRRLSDAPKTADPLAATGTRRPRDPAPGQEGLWEIVPQQPSRPGEVDDDNCFVMDGVAGHAGLFGTATDVARFGQAVLEELSGAGKLAPAPLWRRALQHDASTPGSTRAMGFDLPSETGSSSGSRFSRQSIGHTGFTGTSLWIDPTRRLVVALLSNRTLPGRANLGIRDFRPSFHDAAVEASGG